VRPPVIPITIFDFICNLRAMRPKGPTPVWVLRDIAETQLAKHTSQAND
jgi:hypothetical protein